MVRLALLEHVMVVVFFLAEDPDEGLTVLLVREQHRASAMEVAQGRGVS